MRKTKTIPFIISIIIVLALIYFSDPYRIYISILSANKVYILLALFISVINIFLRALKWKVILGKSVGFFELMPIQLFGMTISSFTPGKIAEPAKAVLLKLRKGIPVSESLPTVIWERINDVLSTMLLSIVAIQAISIRSDILLLGAASLVFFVVVISVVVLAMKSKKFGLRVFFILRKLPLMKYVSDDFVDRFYSIKTGKISIIKSFVITFVAWALEGAILGVVLASMGVSINFILLAGVIALSILIGTASSLQGGIGSSEFVMIVLLGIAGVGGAAAVSGVFLYRIVSFWFASVVGGAAFLYLSRKIDMKSFLK
ncbi:MAG TPA: flippase-like domain-containing protein [archaeon]|nr:flippase-like domain-containing protein [archaeon]